MSQIAKRKPSPATRNVWDFQVPGLDVIEPRNA